MRTETGGVVKLNSTSVIYTINFEDLEEGTDLWLFWQTSNKNINDLAVILTAGFDGRVWYQKKGNNLIIFGDKEGEVSVLLHRG